MGGKGAMGCASQQMGMMGGKGMMPQGMMGMMPQGQRPAAPPQQGGPPAQPAQGGSGAPLSAAALAAVPPSVQKQMVGERLFPLIAKHQPELAGKITGMMLEMENTELLLLLESEQHLKTKVDEALIVLGSKK